VLSAFIFDNYNDMFFINTVNTGERTVVVRYQLSILLDGILWLGVT